MPSQISAVITGVSAVFCQKIHSQCPVSEYQPSIAAPIFCEKTKRNEYAARPQIHQRGARLRRMNPNAAGMNVPTASPRTNCSAITVSQSLMKGGKSEDRAK